MARIETTSGTDAALFHANGLDIRAHDASYSADFGVMLDVMHSRGALSDAVAESFDFDVELDLMPELEAVGGGLGRAIDLHRTPSSLW